MAFNKNKMNRTNNAKSFHGVPLLMAGRSYNNKLDAHRHQSILMMGRNVFCDLAAIAAWRPRIFNKVFDKKCRDH